MGYVMNSRSTAAPTVWHATTSSKPQKRTVLACTMMPSGSVVAIVFQMPMPMAFVTMWMTALGNSISVAFAMARVPFTSVDVQPFLPAIAIAKAISWTSSGCVEATAFMMRIKMGYAMTSMPALASTTPVAFAMAQVRFMTADAADIPAGDCDCEGNQLDALGVCGGNCGSDEDADGVCDDAEILGCTFQWACNYEPMATEDDGSCEEDSCAGCMEVAACNYDQEATIDDGSCQYPEDGFGCDGSCLDLNQNTFCDIDEQSFGPVLVVMGLRRSIRVL